MSKLLVFVHGIGNSQVGFERAWIEALPSKLQLPSDLTIKGLLWEDVLQEVATRYPVVSGPLVEIFEMAGVDKLKGLTSNANWTTINDYMMDVLVYVGLEEMWTLIENTCIEKLRALRYEGEEEIFEKEDTILVGHSLGAGMLPHIVWKEFLLSGSMAYRGLILLASPLGFETPNKNLCEDFLSRMGRMFGNDRPTVLAKFASAWDRLGQNRLKFISNVNDIVCADVQFPIGGKVVDVIPLKQGFSPLETGILNDEHPGSFQWVEFGERSVKKIGANHDVLTYLKQPEFAEALKGMLT